MISKMKNKKHFKARLTKEEIAILPRRKFNGEIFYINTIKTFREVLPLLNHEGIYGFDTETKPSFKKGKKNEVSLLQLSTSNQAFLFRVNQIGIPSKLINILSDGNLIKVGVAIHDDLLGLKRLTSFHPDGFIDLQDYVKNFDIEDSGLKKLTANILGFKISKRQQTSNWESEVLTEAQIEYAATDAWVCYEIYSKLEQMKPYNGKEIEGNS